MPTRKRRAQPTDSRTPTWVIVTTAVAAIGASWLVVQQQEADQLSRCQHAGGQIVARADANVCVDTNGNVIVLPS